MIYTKLKNINKYVSKSVNPMRTPDSMFEMYSVPIYDTGHPEYLVGREIGSSKISVQKGDILLCKINPRINRVWIVAKESNYPNIASSEWIVIRSPEYNPAFLAWYFKSPNFRKLMVSQVTGIGGSLTRAQPKAVAEYPVPVLSLGEQNSIARILDKVSSIIDVRKQQLAKLDELVKSRFVEMFGDPRTNSKRWPTGIIRDVVQDIHYGTSHPAVAGGKYYYLRMNNITYDGYLDISDLKKIDIPDEEFPKCCVQKGDLLFNRTNSKDLVGKTCVYTLDETMVIAGFIIRVRVNEKMLPEFLSAYLNTPYSKCVLSSMCKTSIGQANINAQEMQNIKLFIPPIELQHQYVCFLNQINKTKSIIQKSLAETQLLFDSLMQKYFG